MMPTIKPITKPPTPHEKINVAANQPKAPKTMPNTPPNVTRPINLPKKSPMPSRKRAQKTKILTIAATHIKVESQLSSNPIIILFYYF